MAESQGNGLKTAANGLFHKNFEFGPLFQYDNFQNEIDTWETTVQCGVCAPQGHEIIEQYITR